MVCRASARLVNQYSFKPVSRKRALKLSTKAFWIGSPGSINWGIIYQTSQILILIFVITIIHQPVSTASMIVSAEVGHILSVKGIFVADAPNKEEIIAGSDIFVSLLQRPFRLVKSDNDFLSSFNFFTLEGSPSRLPGRGQVSRPPHMEVAKEGNRCIASHVDHSNKSMEFRTECFIPSRDGVSGGSFKLFAHKRPESEPGTIGDEEEAFVEGALKYGKYDQNYGETQHGDGAIDHDFAVALFRRFVIFITICALALFSSAWDDFFKTPFSFKTHNRISLGMCVLVVAAGILLSMTILFPSTWGWWL